MRFYFLFDFLIIVCYNKHKKILISNPNIKKCNIGLKEKNNKTIFFKYLLNDYRYFYYSLCFLQKNCYF